MRTREEILKGGIQAANENAEIDFKSHFNPDSLPMWLELIKDVVAMANSGGGVIFLGVDDNGVPTGADLSAILDVDPATITDKVYKYTDQQFQAFSIETCEKSGVSVCAIIVGLVSIPLVFSKTGNYQADDGKQKNAFMSGTVYFRHGAKSEPGNSHDLRSFLERQLENIRKAWLNDVAKIVEAPVGSRITVLPPEVEASSSTKAIPVRIVDDPSAPPYYAIKVDDTHPHRQKEVVQKVNERLHGRKGISTYDILCIRRVFAIQRDLNYCYTMNFASPRYSNDFVDWICQSYDSDPQFFEKTKAKYDEMKAKINEP